MRTPPSPNEISEWLRRKNPLGLFRNKTFTLHDIDPKPWSGHFNYVVRIGRKKFVLRFKGPEWGKTKGIVDEYLILRSIARYKVGPLAHYLSRDFFGEAMMLQDYLPGKALPSISGAEQLHYFPLIARTIAQINTIPLRSPVLRRHSRLTYKPDHTEWMQRLRVIVANPRTRSLGKRIERLMPKAEMMIRGFQKNLSRTLGQHGARFIFESSHAGHCIVSPRKITFINWEHVSFGDPSYTLAVFLTSISRRNDFMKIKRQMIDEYLKWNYISGFDTLLEQRLHEREISNLLWVLWAYVDKKDTNPVDKATDAKQRLQRVETILK